MHQKRSPKFVTSGNVARKGILAGALKLSKTVATSYGPGGRTALLDRFAGLLITRDGVTIAREVELEDPLENLGCKILKETCLKVNERAGDGTTTTAVLAGEILQQGHKMVLAGHDPNLLTKGVRWASQQVIESLQGQVLPVEDPAVLEQVALISSNGDEEIARHLADAILGVGKDGTVSIETGEGRTVEVIFKEGIEYPSGPASTVFLGTNTERILDKPLVAVVMGTLSTVADVQDILEEASQYGHELLLIAESIIGEALQTIVLNDSKGVVKCVAFGGSGLGLRRKGPLEDICALSGATLVDRLGGMSLQGFPSEWFGGFQSVQVGMSKAVFTAVPEAHDSVAARVEQLQEEMLNSPHEYDRDRLRERIAKLQGGMAILKVGGETEAEIKERRARIEDALGATQSALKAGVVPGGGAAYLHALATLQSPIGEHPDFLIGVQVLKKALESPTRQIVSNAFQSADFIIASSVGQPERFGWDVKQACFRDLFTMPMVIDPYLVSSLALETAVSVACTLLTAEAAILPKK